MTYRSLPSKACYLSDLEFGIYLQAKGKTILTNGAFDVLHVGHIRCLTEAKKYGDYLIVGINSDDSVRQLKGPKRPIVPEEERAEMLLALKPVDFVVIFRETNPNNLIEAIKPNVYFKGTDYGMIALPEQEQLSRLNITTIFTGDQKTRSSSNMIDRMMEDAG